MSGTRLTNQNNVIEKPMFGVSFIFYLKSNYIKILRGGTTEVLDTIFIGEKLNYEQFKDECVCWCDQNAA